MPITTVAALMAYFLAPFLFLRLRQPWSVPAAIFGLWLPIELGWLPVAASVAGIAAAALAFDAKRDGISIRQQFDPAAFSLKTALVNFAVFGGIAVPLGMAIDFISPNFDAAVAPAIPRLFLVILATNALPEEILFRGLIQNWQEQRFRNSNLALIGASIIFGAAHLNNGPPYPNYGYFLMASLAGIFYGRAWAANRSVLTSTLTHTLVNAAWRVFFRG